jgi:hypothetical protein
LPNTINAFDHEPFVVCWPVAGKFRASPAAPRASRRSGYMLDKKVGFLLRVAMRRHTALFMSHMITDLTQT